MPFSKRDSVLCYYWNDIFNKKQQRHLITCFRKSELCQCACRGKCSQLSIMRVITWSFRCLSDGFFPAQGHDGRELPGGMEEMPIAGTRGIPCGLGRAGKWAGFPAVEYKGRPLLCMHLHQGNNAQL